ncbi:MAG: acetyl-CoA carboxylase carboxyltransferase subunit alpha [Proteobacteria bacterium]|nr:acetyl-CoA carboxylase carboxyltransferase subunit alpha [Pseudomonadota bacterium]MDA1057471.1 acetyl-CoA carboxylase carboxyltransferase subunit alpha [Pseudomonadota bacterium]
MSTFLDFEKPVAELEGKIKELRHSADGGDVNISDELGKLEAKVDQVLKQIYGKLSPWQKIQVARHPDRPHFSNYIETLFEDFVELCGDRAHGNDTALVGGIARFRGRSVFVIGHEKGSGTDGRVRHNFGMAHPEGYRKTTRLMNLANHYNLPVLTFVDTPGAYPGVEAEERGQSEAIARSIEASLRLEVPFVASIVGEGGSGGAVALATADRVLMLEHAVYSVISPEGCASILWRSAARAQDAADALKLTAEDLLALKVIDQVVDEPLGAAHRHPTTAIRALGDEIERTLLQLISEQSGSRRLRRREKFLAMGRA